MAGISDIRHELCLALALWNGEDPILKERMFGLTGPQGNHGEDVKEYWWYLEGLPSHALLHWRYHYPQVGLPLRASSSTTAVASRIPSSSCSTPARSTTTATGRSTSPTPRRRRRRSSLGSWSRTTPPRRRRCEVLPTLWFRNTWSWGDEAARPRIEGDGSALVVADHALAGYRLEAAPGPDGALPEALFCENETNAPRIFGSDATTTYPKDGINDHVVSGAADGQPGRVRHQGGAPLSPDRAGRGHGRAAAAAASPGRRAAGDRPSGRAARSTRRSPHARRMPTSSTARSRRPGLRRSRCRSCASPAPVSSGASRSTRTTCAAGWTGIRASCRRPTARRARPQQRLAPPRQLRRARDAGSVGVPVVRGVGSRVPHDPLGASRPGVREVPAPGAAARVVPASERRAAGVRVELRRRQPAGARDGGDPRLPDRRRPRSRVPRAHLPEAARQLHLVAEPRGRRRQQRLQRRLPRSGQHQPDRPFQPPGGGRARAGRRDCVDGLLRAHDARDRDRARGGERRLPGHGDQVPRAVRADRAGARSGRASTTATTGSSTTGSITPPETARR